MQRILITGAAGAIGTALRAAFAGVYRPLRVSDIRPMTDVRPDEETVQVDLTDAAAVEALMSGIDCVVHLGGVPREGEWQAILDNNIVGTYNVFEGARRAGVKRVVFASSNHAIGFYRATRPVGIDEPVRPDSRYGVSKAFGEALARLYADKHSLSVACLRIGSFRPRPENLRQLATWVSPRDLAQLVRCCIDASEFHYLVLYGVSNNARSRWRNTRAARIGYAPQDNAEDYVEKVNAKSAEGERDPAALFHGGEFCALEFSGDVTAID